MLKTNKVLLISLLSLLHCVTCDDFDFDFDYDIEVRLSYLSLRMGSCAKYFQYQRIDEFINGRLELPNIKMGDTVAMTFYRNDFKIQIHFDGTLLPDESAQTVINKIQNNQSIAYRIDFPLSENVPELNKIFVNAKELCATEHYSTEDILVLKHTMEIINGSLPVFTYNINIPHFIKNPTCGMVDAGLGLTPLVYGGSEVIRGEYPWLAAIFRKEGTGIRFICGGSLMTSRIILTAAHCFQGSFMNADKIVAIVGRYNLSNNLEDSYVINEIEDLILHPEYEFGTGFSDADLAILKLKNPVSFSKFINPICLWLEAADESLIVNHTAVVTGWGSDENGNTITEVPKQAKINIVSENTCLRSSPAYNGLTSSRTLCAGNRDGSGPCEGDSGGGLTINRYGRWMLRGVVSAGLINQNRCNLKEYTVYCDVAKHTKWLERYVGEEKLISGSIEEVCGISGTDIRGEHPWLGAVYQKLPTGIRFSGTGVLVSSRTVLFRAGWLVSTNGVKFSPTEYRIYFGRYDLNNIRENTVVTRDIANFVFHPDFKTWTESTDFTANSIVLLQLKDPVRFTDNVKPICLWSEPNDGRSSVKGQSATLSSWDTAGVFDETFTVPTSAKVNISSIQQCQSWGYDESTSSRILCVPRLENKNGAIMMIKRKGRWLLRGINALRDNYKMYMSKDYFVYLDIAKYLTWIQENMLS